MMSNNTLDSRCYRQFYHCLVIRLNTKFDIYSGNCYRQYIQCVTCGAREWIDDEWWSM